MWKKYGSYNLYNLDIDTSSKTRVAIFDLYGTLITSRNATINFSRIKADNFVFLGEDSIFSTLSELLKQKFKIFILSSSLQNSLSQVKLVQKSLPEKITYIHDNRFNITHLKSYISMIKLIATYIDIDYKNSFYCGDQIGREDSYPPYRISDIDTKIAEKCNLGEVVRPIDIFGSYIPYLNNYPELIITIGNSGSGKSSMSALLSSQRSTFPVIPCDTDAMPGWDRLLTLKCIEKNLALGNSAISVATNYNYERRLELVEIAKKYKVPVRMLWFVRDGRPFNKYRGKGDNKIPSTFVHLKPIPEPVYRSYTEKFEDPEKDIYDYKKVTLEIVY